VAIDKTRLPTISSPGERPVTPGTDTAAPISHTLHAADGYPIKGFVWRHLNNERAKSPVVIINPATSVRCNYYFRFAAFLFEHGFNVVTYDYRGIGGARPATLRNFQASWIDWGRLDFEAVLCYVEQSFSDQPIHVVAHSVGGLVLGFAKSNHLIRRIFTMGAQYAYWRDYAAGKKLQMLAKWHVSMPLPTISFGYFPGKRFGWLEDTPKGIVLDWILSSERLEDARTGSAAQHVDKKALLQRFAAVTAPTLAVSVTDDEFGTIPAVERLLAYFSQSLRTHLRISPQSIGETMIGHFGFFNARFEQKLWQLPLLWLQSGRLPNEGPAIPVSSKRVATTEAVAGMAVRNHPFIEAQRRSH